MSIYRNDLPPLFLERSVIELSSAGDFNGDGYGDFMFACQNFASGDPGDVFVVQGGPYLPTAVETIEQGDIPDEYDLGQNYPNPFNSSTKIEFNLAQNDTVTLSIYNILGQKVATLIEGKTYSAGTHVVDWNGKLDDNSDAPSGVYFYKLTTSLTGESKKMVIVK